MDSATLNIAQDNKDRGMIQLLDRYSRNCLIALKKQSDQQVQLIQQQSKQIEWLQSHLKTIEMRLENLEANYKNESLEEGSNKRRRSFFGSP